VAQPESIAVRATNKSAVLKSRFFILASFLSKFHHQLTSMSTTPCAVVSRPSRALVCASVLSNSNIVQRFLTQSRKAAKGKISAFLRAIAL
jgi:hypothetical protein